MTSLTNIFWITISSLIFLTSNNNPVGDFTFTSSISESPELEKAPYLDDFNASEVDLAPELINRGEIESLIGYPAVAWDAGIEGKVVLKVLVDEKGYYLKHEVLESFHPLLRIPCEGYAKFLAFSPAQSNKESVKCWVEVPFEFKIP